MNTITSVLMSGFIACMLLFSLTNQAVAKKNIKLWEAKLQEHLALPSRLIAVDKDKQQLVVLNGNGLSAPQKYICTTGQTPGDKQAQGDLKTPEGIYFVNTHVASGLDYFMYGNEAYTLNYPNPVDKLRRKTGYGIWIHGKGEPIRPLLTQGCVAMQNDDLASIGDILEPGTPITLANSLTYDPNPPEAYLAKIAKLTKNVEDWTKAWSARSNKFFEFYDSKAYTASTEDFTKFKAQKTRLFKSLQWIKTEASNIHVLQGPGYWVTWFAQDYAASNLSIKGVRRLYWYETKNGDFKIVGMEWLPKNYLPTEAMYVVMDKEPPHAKLRKKNSMLLADTGEQNSSLSQASDAPNKNFGIPETKELKDAASASEDISGTMTESEEVPVDPEVDATTEPQLADITTIVAESTTSDLSSTTAINELAEASPVAAPENTPEQATTPLSTPVVTIPSLAKLYASTDVILDAANQEQAIQDAVIQWVELWRKTWESGNITEYLTFYAPTATQGGILSKEKIALHKTKLWKKIAPQQITLSNIQVDIYVDHAIVQMAQVYEGSDGSGDQGTKTLYIEKTNGSWIITREEWRAE